MEPRFNLFDSPTAARVAKRFYNVSLALDQSTLPKTLRELMQLRVSQLNGCGFCVDIHTKEGAAAGETPLRLNLVAAWRDAKVFTDAERAVLELTEQGTRIADGAGGVSDEVWANAAKYFDTDQLAAVVCTIGLINLYNRGNVILQNEGGDYQPGQWH